MGVSVVVEMRMMDDVILRVEAIKQRSMNLSVPLRQAGSLMLYSTQQNFDEQGRPPWMPLKASTLKRKASQGYPSTILEATGRLRSSITYKVLAQSLTVGTSVRYGKYHQSSLPRSSNLPRRQFLRFQEQDIEDIQALISEYVTKGVS